MSENEEMGMGEEYDEPPEGEVTEEMFDEEEGAYAASSEDESLEEEEGSLEEEDQFSEVDENLVQLQAEIETQLLGQPYSEDGDPSAEDACEGGGNIVGVGLGMAEDSSDLDPGDMCVNVYVVEPMSDSQIRSVIVDSFGVSASSCDAAPINVIESGFIDAQPHRFRIRPAPGGVSVGHFRITAGTLGCLARGRKKPRNRRSLILSNNHVLANSTIAFLIQLWIVPIPAEFGGVEVEPLEELPEAVADLGERFVERKMFAEVILPLEPQVFCRVLFRGVGSKQQTRHGPLCLRYPRIFASQKLLHLGPPVIAGSIPQV